MPVRRLSAGTGTGRQGTTSEASPRNLHLDLALLACGEGDRLVREAQRQTVTVAHLARQGRRATSPAVIAHGGE